jgi:D-aminoacyl-tRNA deacylase
MRALLQRVSQARVSVAGSELARIDMGVLILLGIGRSDGEAQARFLADKIAHLRIFEDADGKTNLSLADVNGEALVVSQFTLYADAQKGRRPSFGEAAPPEAAAPMVDRFVELLRGNGIPTRMGSFGAHMLLEIHNDGPFTIWLEK